MTEYSLVHVEDFARIEEIYHTRLEQDFPDNERKPLSSIRRMWECGSYEVRVFERDGEVLAYAFFLRLGDNGLLDYFAVDEEHRGEGLGTRFLSRLAECLQGLSCVLVEAEDPEKAVNGSDRVRRERRLRFYKRSAFRQTALTSTVFGADYRVLEAPVGREHSTEEIRAIYTALCRFMLPDPFFDREFHIHAPAGPAGTANENPLDTLPERRGQREA